MEMKEEERNKTDKEKNELSNTHTQCTEGNKQRRDMNLRQENQEECKMR